jgi:hypothetical protein
MPGAACFQRPLRSRIQAPAYAWHCLRRDGECSALLKPLRAVEQHGLGGVREPPDERVQTSANCTANLQVFCRENSGNVCPVSVCLCSALVKGAGGHAWRAISGTIGLLSNTECADTVCGVRVLCACWPWTEGNTA